MYEVTLLDTQHGQVAVVFNDVIEDGIITLNHTVMPYRFLVTSDNTRIEFPMDRYIIKFGQNRQVAPINQ